MDESVGLVRTLAAGLYRQSGGAADRDELQSAGFAGLVCAAQRYHPGRGTAFASFAYYRILGAMRDQMRAARDVEHHDGDPADVVEDPHPPADALLAAREALVALGRGLAELPGRERLLVERCYFDGVTLSIVAEELGISTSRASRLRCRAVAALRARVEDVLAT